MPKTNIIAIGRFSLEFREREYFDEYLNNAARAFAFSGNPTSTWGNTRVRMAARMLHIQGGC